MKIFSTVSKLWSGHDGVDTIFILILSKGNKKCKSVGGVMVLFLCTSSDNASYLYRVS